MNYSKRGRAAGVKSIFVRTGHGKHEEKFVVPDVPRASNLYEAVTKYLPIMLSKSGGNVLSKKKSLLSNNSWFKFGMFKENMALFILLVGMIQ